jgi:hypothetical protein
VESTGGHVETSLGRQFGRWVVDANNRDEAVAEVRRRVASDAPQPTQWDVRPKAGVVRNLLGVTLTGGAGPFVSSTQADPE